jgi:hypothetical protein
MDTLTPEQISKLNKTISRMERYRPNPDSFKKEICCEPYTILYGNIEFLRHYMDPQMIPGQTQADFDEKKDLNHALMAEFIKDLIYIEDNEGLKLLLERMNICKHHKFIIYGGQPQEYERVYGQLPRYDESHFFEETSVNILNFCFLRNNLEAFKMFLEDGVNHNCLTKNKAVYIPEDPHKIVELTVFSKMILRFFLLCFFIENDWTGFRFNGSWRRYTSTTFRSRVKQFIKAALLRDNPDSLRRNLEWEGRPSTQMLVSRWVIGLDDIDNLLWGRNELLIRYDGYKLKENYDEERLLIVLLEIEKTLESCISEVEKYNLMVAKQRASVGKAFESQGLSSLADSYLDQDTRRELLTHVLQQTPSVSLSSRYEPDETFEGYLRSNGQGGGDKQTKKKTKQTKKKNKQTKKKKGIKSNKEFLYNSDDPEKSFDVYIDKDPSDTIPIKYRTIKDVKNTIKKLEKLYKNGKYSHKRIWQVGMIMYVRLKVLKDKKPKEFKLSEKYFKHLGKRTKIKGEKERKKHTFKI